MSVASWFRSLWTGAGAQDAATYKGAIDGNFAVLERLGAQFAPQQSATPAMTVTVRAGTIMDNGILTEVAQQVTAAIAAPVGNPRIDRVVVYQRTGALTVVTGTPAATPVPPAIPIGYMPCAQVLLQTTSTIITNAMITDERCLITCSDAYADATFLPIGGNAASATTAAACTGNSATATSAAACTGNSATATSAAACTGNAATATSVPLTLGNAVGAYDLSVASPTTYSSTFATPANIRPILCPDGLVMVHGDSTAAAFVDLLAIIPTLYATPVVLATAGGNKTSTPPARVYAIDFTNRTLTLTMSTGGVAYTVSTSMLKMG